MITSMIDTAATGIDSLGYNVGMLLLLIITATQTAVIPDFYKFSDKKEYKRLDITIWLRSQMIKKGRYGVVFQTM